MPLGVWIWGMLCALRITSPIKHAKARPQEARIQMLMMSCPPILVGASTGMA